MTSSSGHVPEKPATVETEQPWQEPTCEEAKILGTEMEVVGVEFDSRHDHHCWSDRELFHCSKDF